MFYSSAPPRAVGAVGLSGPGPRRSQAAPSPATGRACTPLILAGPLGFPSSVPPRARAPVAPPGLPQPRGPSPPSQGQLQHPQISDVSPPFAAAFI